MKKIFLILIFFLMLPVFAADKLQVEALEDFNSVLPKKEFKVKLAADGKIGDIFLIKGDILNCVLQKTKAPTRAKRDAKAYFEIDSYEDSLGLHKIDTVFIAKYAQRILSKEEIKKIPPKSVIKKVGGTVADFFVTGVSYGISFVDGLITNNEENRLKSGVKQVYDDSFVSLIEYGDEIIVKKGDIFYFIVTEDKDIKAAAASKLNDIKIDLSL
ncbi:MAG: hypothetical protein IJ003_01545 [Candidatus Gastranaerophilales bacterium]|nr:hypothetical protein [Candidatus Gastranaerophilales bacterium]